MKQKKFILTETGEVRPPKQSEYFINAFNKPELALADFKFESEAGK